MKISIVVGTLIGVGFFFILRVIGFKDFYMIATIPMVPVFTTTAILISNQYQRKYETFHQLTKFTLVGLLNTIFDLGWLYFFIWITGISTGIPYTFFKTVAGILTSIHSYLWHKYWTFERKDERINLKEYSKFLTTILIGLVINIITASTIVNVIGPQFNIPEIIWAGVGALAAALVTWLWNFWIIKRVVFKK